MIKVNYKSSIAIYEQIKASIIDLILKGVFQKDEQLPSVRFLAQELMINQNTIQKAYSELEREGITYTVRGKGSFVNYNKEELLAKYEPELFRSLEKVLEELFKVGITKERITSFVMEYKSKEKGVDSDDSTVQCV